MKITLVLCLLLFSTLSLAQSFSKDVAQSVSFTLSWVKKHPLPPPLFAHLVHLGLEGALEHRIENTTFAGKYFRILEELAPGWTGLQAEAKAAGILTHKDSSSELNGWIAKQKKTLDFARSAVSFKPVWELSAWAPTPPLNANPVLPNWGALDAPSNLGKYADKLMPPHPMLIKHLRDMDEVRLIGDKDSYDPETQATAEFWSADAGTVTPPGMWLEAGINSLLKDARSDRDKIAVLRKLSRALSLAGILCWRIKYRTALWRPITAIRKTGQDFNWLPRLTTPPFPTYVSGHSTFSAAAATVLWNAKVSGLRFYGANTQRYFSHPMNAALEAGESRIFGGIHFRFDNEDGLLLGQEIGKFVSIPMED